MSRSLNKVMLIGTVDKDVETMNTSTGGNLTKISLVTEDGYTAKNGEKKSSKEWHNLVCFGKMGENAANFLKKGNLIHAEGKIKTSKYTAKDGIDKYSTSIMVATIVMLDKAPSNNQKNQNNDDHGNYKPSHNTKKPSPNVVHDDFPDDEIPF